MTLIIKHGWLDSARHVPSPNCDDRPPGVEIDLLVIHGISLPPCRYGGPHIEEFFTNRLDPDAHPYFAQICDLRVSAHVLIGRDGSYTQFVPFDRRAWHAGRSEFRGRQQCNDFSIGIELEGSDDEPYDDRQYGALADLIRVLRGAYPSMTDHAIVGHSDIAPGRKTDPGAAFDWQRLYTLLAEHGEQGGEEGS